MLQINYMIPKLKLIQLADDIRPNNHSLTTANITTRKRCKFKLVFETDQIICIIHKCIMRHRTDDFRESLEDTNNNYVRCM